MSKRDRARWERAQAEAAECAKSAPPMMMKSWTFTPGSVALHAANIPIDANAMSILVDYFTPPSPVTPIPDGIRRAFEEGL